MLTLYDLRFIDKYQFSLKKLNKSHRKQLIRELQQLDTYYLVKGEIKNNKQDYDMLVICGFTSNLGYEHDKFFMFTDLPDNPEEHQKEYFEKVEVSRLVMEEIFEAEDLTLQHQRERALKVAEHTKVHNARGAGRKPVSPAIRQSVIEHLNSGNSIRATAAMLNLAASTVMKIKKEYKS